jgi:ribosomal protein S18 acetylase RimI-like enzyme
MNSNDPLRRNQPENGALIRPAQPAEAAAVRAVVQAAYAPYIARIGKAPGPMLDDYAQRIARQQTWVLQDAGEIAGILVLEDQADALLLDNVAVRPECHGRGHGRALMLHAEAEAARRGFNTIRLYTHVLMTENRALYRRAGYSETGFVSEGGFDRVYMEKAIIPHP